MTKVTITHPKLGDKLVWGVDAKEWCQDKEWTVKKKEDTETARISAIIAAAQQSPKQDK